MVTKHSGRAVFVTALLFFSVFACGPVDRSPGSTSMKIDAIAIGRIYVEQFLKAPGTAKHNAYLGLDNVHYYNDGTYRYSSWVDAQNSFGAMLRLNYDIVLKHQNDKWEVVSFVPKES